MYILLGIVIALILFFIFKYNGFILLKNRTKEAWADIDVQLKRRYNLIPNLVSTVKGYAAHEAGTFQKVTEARSAAMQAGNPAEKGKAENMLSSTLKSLFAVSEAYPQLKANANFLELQEELSDTENKIQAARRFYNGNVRDFNTAIQTFPGNMMANMFRFKEMDLFQLEEGNEAKEPVSVKF